MTDDDVIMTCYISLGSARLHKSEFTLGRGNMGGLYKGVMGFCGLENLLLADEPEASLGGEAFVGGGNVVDSYGLSLVLWLRPL